MTANATTPDTGPDKSYDTTATSVDVSTPPGVG